MLSINSPLHLLLQKIKGNASTITSHAIILQPKIDKALQANIYLKNKTASSSSKITLKSSADHMTLPAKIDASNQTTIKAENGSKFANDKENTALS
ncbi:hypothetical protein [Bartonella acomydis]|uniref:Filamentous hemagglutinin n=1 Tax=Bartonella acomydis TaxID=686234 RepID=A0ABP9MW30_9HYPH